MTASKRSVVKTIFPLLRTSLGHRYRAVRDCERADHEWPFVAPSLSDFSDERAVRVAASLQLIGDRCSNVFNFGHCFCSSRFEVS